MRVPKGVGLGTRRLPGTRSECRGSVVRTEPGYERMEGSGGPLLAISGLFSVLPGTSALPPKADIRALRS